MINKNLLLLIIISFINLFIFTGCNLKVNNSLHSKSYEVKVLENKNYNNLSSSINSLSNQLFINNIKQFKQSSDKIAITTFINNENLKSTSTLGRVISESLVNDLHIKGFRIIDLTTKNNLSINNDGIFFLSRDITKLKEKKGNLYVIVGTYSKFDYDSIILNARLIDSETSDVLSTGRVVYTNKDCSILNTCNDELSKIIRGNN
mgnify:CR=1 FL=1